MLALAAIIFGNGRASDDGDSWQVLAGLGHPNSKVFDPNSQEAISFLHLFLITSPLLISYFEL